MSNARKVFEETFKSLDMTRVGGIGDYSDEETHKFWVVYQCGYDDGFESGRNFEATTHQTTITK